MEHLLEIKLFRGRKWLLVFHHKYETEKDLFKNESDALFCNEKNRFSILGSINDTFKSHGRYEFLLEYPEVAGFNQWSQTKNPLFVEPGESNGYRPISITWSTLGWHGLAKSADKASTLIDGSTSTYTGNWFFAIGAYNSYHYSIPAFININDFNESEKERLRIREVRLWTRIGLEDCSIKNKSDLLLHSISLVIYLILISPN